MILRSHFCVLGLATVYLTSDAFYLKYKAPSNKAIKVIKSDAGKISYPRHIDDITQWLRNNKLKQMVILNRKDKRVEQLIKQLILLIGQSQPAAAKKPKLCQKTFGSIYDERNKRVICERYTSSYNKPPLNLIIPITRNQDASTEDISTNADLRRNLRSRVGFSTTDMSSATSLTEESTLEIERPTRYQIVGNDGKKRNKPFRDSKKPRKVDSNSAAEDESQENESDESFKDDNSNENKGNLGSEESRKKKPLYENESVEEKHSSVKKKPLSDDESLDDKYSYMQGSRVIDSLRRQNRDRYFMPKRYNWDSGELHHLGYYWFEGNRR